MIGGKEHNAKSASSVCLSAKSQLVRKPHDHISRAIGYCSFCSTLRKVLEATNMCGSPNIVKQQRF